MEVHATVYIDRRTDGELEEVGQFRFTDLAMVAASALTERYHYSTEVHFADGSEPIRFEWAKVEKDGVVKTGGTW